MSPAREDRDIRMMRLALRTATRGDGRVYPNPSVGAVVFRGDRVLGRGVTKPPGGAHAEVAAIADATKRHGARALRGASIAVTLEPCNFTGRTGPCTEAILEAGLSRVVGGCRDPHPRVAGKGFARLRRRGVEVETGVLEAECRYQNRGFLSVQERGRPWLTLKLATSLDGRIATASGESRWITGERARAFVHRLRDAHDAVMVGAETARTDDPELTVRRAGRVLREPIRVVIDGRLRVPLSARIFGSDSPASGLDVARTWIVCRENARGRAKRLARGARLIETPSVATGHVDLEAAMQSLAEAGLTRVLIEGGGALSAALFRAHLVDEVHWMLAPRLLGSDGRPCLGPLELERLHDAVSIDRLRSSRLGRDIHLHGLIDHDAKQRSRTTTRRPSTSRARERERKRT